MLQRGILSRRIDIGISWIISRISQTMIVNCLSRFHMRAMLPANVYEKVVKNAKAGNPGLGPLDTVEADLSKAAVALEC